LILRDESNHTIKTLQEEVEEEIEWETRYEKFEAYKRLDEEYKRLDEEIKRVIEQKNRLGEAILQSGLC